jgi:hypothetical protein
VITELHFLAGTVVLTGLLLSVTVGHALSGMAYPGAGAPLLPEGPIRKLVIGNVAFLGLCGVLRLLGV